MMRWIGLLGVVAVACGASNRSGGGCSTGSGEGGDPCPQAGGGCGLNGGWLGANIPFRELSTQRHTPVGHFGISIEDVEDESGNHYTLDVERDQLLATNLVTGVVHRGPKLEGLMLTLHVHAMPSVYYLQIVDVGTTQYWSGSVDSAHAIPTYDFDYKTKKDWKVKGKSTCSPLIQPNDTEFHGQAIVFEGNHYDDEGYIVSEIESTSRLFNFACKGTALSKLHFHRHTKAAHVPVGNHPTLAQHQTLLRMLAADYCGIGHPFTTDGHQLEYTYVQRWKPVIGFTIDQNDRLDAIWGAQGATCVDTPRLGAYILDAMFQVPGCHGRIPPHCPPGAAQAWKQAYDAWQTFPLPNLPFGLSLPHEERGYGVALSHD